MSDALIGTQAFLPSLISQIRAAASPAVLPLDQVIFQSILICLIAGDKHLILRTPEEDVGLAVKLTIWTLSSIFNLPTQKVKIKPTAKPIPKRRSSRHRATTPSQSQTTPPRANKPKPPPITDYHSLVAQFRGPDPDTDAFLRSLFLPTHLTGHSRAPSTIVNAPQPHSETSHDETSASASGESRKPSMMKNSRSRSYSNNMNSQFVWPEPMAPATSNSVSSGPSSPTSILRPQPMYAYPTPTLPSPRLPHAHTDPLPIQFPHYPGRPQSAGHSHSHSGSKGKSKRRQRKKSASSTVHSRSRDSAFGDDEFWDALDGSTKDAMKLPNALVVSGLENAEVEIQRCLSGVLGDKKVVLPGQMVGLADDEWTFPECFICVYVCPWNATDYPRIHKSLLDKFAMSTNLFIPQNIRNDFKMLSFSIPFVHATTPTIASPTARLPPTTTRPFHGVGFSSHSHSNPNSPAAPKHAPLPNIVTSHGQGHSYSRSRTTPPLPSMPNPLPHMSSSYPSPVHPHYPTFRPPTPLTPGFPSSSHHLPLLSSSFSAHLSTLLRTLREYCASHTYVSPTLELYLADLLSATRHNSKLNALLLSARASRDAGALVRASRVIGTDLTGGEVIRGDFIAHSAEESEITARQSIDVDGYDFGDEEEWDEHADGDTARQSRNRRSKGGSTLSAPKVVRRTLEVSEVDIARIFPRVVSHRVKLRDGPEDEILAGAVFGATFDSSDIKKPSAKTDTPAADSQQSGQDLASATSEDKAYDSVKSVLVHILSEV